VPLGPKPSAIWYSRARREHLNNTTARRSPPTGIFDPYAENYRATRRAEKRIGRQVRAASLDARTVADVVVRPSGDTTRSTSVPS
jgi:hypothetical protein